MNGIHDMGGMHGFGRVRRDPDEPVFHATWEGRVLAMTRALSAMGAWNGDMARASRELLPPATYLSSSYYRKWALGLEQLLLDAAMVTREELATGEPRATTTPTPRPAVTIGDMGRTLTRRPFSRPVDQAPRFQAGDAVVTRNIHPETHTRLPRYARGRRGVIERIHGAHVFPDSGAIGLGENPQWLYTVRFTARELWGQDAEPTVRVSIDAFEPYLEPDPT